MSDRDSFFQNAASATDDKFSTAMSDYTFHYSGSHRPTDTRMNESQPFAFMFNLIQRIRVICPVIDSNDFRLFLFDNFFNHFAEETNNAMLWNIARLKNA